MPAQMRHKRIKRIGLFVLACKHEADSSTDPQSDLRAIEGFSFGVLSRTAVVLGLTGRRYKPYQQRQRQPAGSQATHNGPMSFTDPFCRGRRRGEPAKFGENPRAAQITLIAAGLAYHLDRNKDRLSKLHGTGLSPDNFNNVVDK
jgi:hypothetical protein